MGPIMSRSGYGNHTRDIARAIIETPDKYSLTIIPVNWGNCPDTALEKDNPIHEEISKRIPAHGSQLQRPDIFIRVSIPNEFEPQGNYNIGITAGIETTVCAPEWLQGANKMDMLITTSEHSQHVMEATSYEKKNKQTGQLEGVIALKPDLKKEVLFEGLDLDVYKKTSTIDEKVKEELSGIKESFCFLFVGHWLQGVVGEDRKDVGMLIHTFVNTFKNTPASKRPALVLKTSGAGFSVSDRENIMNKIRGCIGDVKNPPNVYLLHGDFTDEQMNSLYNHSKMKAMISFTKGEGFGRPLLEYSITGKPVIASGWSGHMDFLNPDGAVLLPGEIKDIHKSVRNQWFVEGAQWFTVNYPFAHQVMKDVFKNYDKYLKKAAMQRKITKTKFSFEKMKEKFIGMLDEAVASQPAQQSISLPKLKKVGGGDKVKLPKLKKVEQDG